MHERHYHGSWFEQILLMPLREEPQNRRLQGLENEHRGPNPDRPSKEHG